MRDRLKKYEKFAKEEFLKGLTKLIRLKGMKDKRVPLSKVKNFGPVTLAEFEAMGICFIEQIDSLGFEETCRLWVQYFPERLNANAFIGIACALDRITWTKATDEHRQAAHTMVQLLRKEYFLPPAKKAKIRRRK